MSMRSLQTNSARSSWRRDERNFIGISWTTNTSKLRNGGSNDCRKFWMSLMCGSQDLTLQAILSNGVATVRQTLRRMFSAMAAERAKKRRKLVLTPVGVEKRAPERDSVSVVSIAVYRSSSSEGYN